MGPAPGDESLSPPPLGPGSTETAPSYGRNRQWRRDQNRLHTLNLAHLQRVSAPHWCLNQCCPLRVQNCIPVSKILVHLSIQGSFAREES